MAAAAIAADAGDVRLDGNPEGRKMGRQGNDSQLDHGRNSQDDQYHIGGRCGKPHSDEQTGDDDQTDQQEKVPPGKKDDKLVEIVGKTRERTGSHHDSENSDDAPHGDRRPGALHKSGNYFSKTHPGILSEPANDNRCANRIKSGDERSKIHGKQCDENRDRKEKMNPFHDLPDPGDSMPAFPSILVSLLRGR